ncbi:hypothetical protein CEXT_177741 [Caerostris extrusa]|uniref:Uncharacterized protein n=1 Tax=Caerostris extrusa TaxID=172846 RepID=A0AAV4R456_CAEEX|nr:hypothetical protein CEXT_177741 [Caerostris extrusa]
MGNVAEVLSASVRGFFQWGVALFEFGLPFNSELRIRDWLSDRKIRPYLSFSGTPSPQRPTDCVLAGNEESLRLSI